jgi:hypothetical protein
VSKYTPRRDGEWFFVARAGHIVACCHCGLVHQLRFRLRGSHIEMQATRNMKMTAARRRSMKKGKADV